MFRDNEIMERLGSIKQWMIDIDTKLAAIHNELSENNKLLRYQQVVEEAKRKHMKVPTYEEMNGNG